MADLVASWDIQDGICTRVGQTELQKYGCGIYLAKYLDLITRHKIVRFDQNAKGSGVRDLYILLAIELLTGKLLNV